MGLVAAIDLVDLVIERAVERLVAEPLALAVDDDRMRLADDRQRAAPQRLAFLILLARHGHAQRGDVGHRRDARAERPGEAEVGAVDG